MYEINVRASVAESVLDDRIISCRGRKFYPRYFLTGFGFHPAFCRVVTWILSTGTTWLGHNPLRIQYRGSECVGLHRCGVCIYIYICVCVFVCYLFTYLLTDLLTPWSRVLLEKLTGFQLVKKFAAF